MLTGNPPLKELLELRTYDEIITDLYVLYDAFLKTAPSPDDACEKHFTVHMIIRAISQENSKGTNPPTDEQ
jgi:hypothetical protein